MTQEFIAFFAILGYLFAAWLLIGQVFLQKTGRFYTKCSALLISMTGTAFHAILLFPQLYTSEGLNFGFFIAASLVAWLATAMLTISALKKPVENLGIFLFPIASIAILLSILFANDQLVLSNSSWQLKSHILISISAFSLLSIGFLQSILLSIQDRQLKRKHFTNWLRALPPLQTMEALLFHFLTGGFFLLSLALVSGITFIEDIFAQHLVHKTILSIIAWFVFAVLLWGRWQFGWRGSVAIRWTYGGFIFLLLAYFGSKFVIDLVLN